MSEQGQTWIRELNSRAQQYQNEGMDAYGAVEQAAVDFKLTVLVEGDVCRVYQTPEGTLVNCWVDQIASNMAKGGQPSMNNTNWFTQK